MKGLITAIRTLTILPVPGKESKDLSSALPWFPVVGLILGGVLFAAGTVWVKLLSGDWFAGGALLILLAEILLTRGLHLDGIADWADAIGGGRDRETRLKIMKDSHLGTFGVIALVLVLLVKWAALERLLSFNALIWLLPVMIVSRAMMGELIGRLPYARSGNGMARPFVEGARPGQRIVAWLVFLAFCFPFGPVGFALMFAGWAIAIFLAHKFRRVFHGITGDLLGTANELIETVLLMSCALSGPYLMCYTGWKWIF